MKKIDVKIIEHFGKAALKPKREDYIKALISFLSWFLPAFLFVLWSSAYYPESEFYSKAADEGKAPNFWNLIGSLGVLLFGVCLLFPKAGVISYATNKVLLNTYSVGCLTLGLVVGQLFFLPYDTLTWWQAGLFGSGVVVSLFVVICFNLIVWYLAFLTSRCSQFLDKLATLSVFYRLPISLGILSLIVYLLLNA
ncbi:hypothetical protein [Vibrio parahaemolyticus]|uniref:hypothetical protein n=1 Tax=Vibrio parahaemolyticus TaxID=670 RepID=UPI00193CE766|nr:hypothetical protein [Vibrio parahaemolyticus]EGQ8517832.1 hypothetical protein [Vibrio parahaemolyticus]EIY8044120.1 hypothetical protein [Vibrio vulnificus]MBM4941686.1 hypothetical protein [Vibrio parahaemolyticus]HCE4631211.1 hypothetical protein [Vibrio parahaemolyticus]